jgi:DNA-binding NtrC family response regulator
MKINLLLIDDDWEFTRDVKQFLETRDYQVTTAATLAEGRNAFLQQLPDIILLDLNLPDGLGTELLAEFQSRAPEIPVVMLTAFGSIEKAVEAMKAGAENFLTKPIEPDHLLLTLQRLNEKVRLLNQLRAHELAVADRWNMVVGESAAMKQVIKDATTAARQDVTVLITGETGTGKHLMAHYIHQNSPRAAFPFVYINCATLSDTLLESDLFGHEKGAFTGALKQKRGRVELAHRGTLFLDEIGELPLNLQAKLLHFLEYGEFNRVGGTEILRSDVRLICATNRELETMVAEGFFREDLFYRINVIRIRIPPLRERSEDISPLFEHFFRKFAREFGKPRLGYAPELVDALSRHSWPGNIRELQNAVERAIVLCPRNQLSEQDFSFLSRGAAKAAEPFQPRPLQEALADFKRDYICKILEYTGGNQTRAAKILRIQRTYLNRLMKDLGVG